MWNAGHSSDIKQLGHVDAKIKSPTEEEEEEGWKQQETPQVEVKFYKKVCW